MYVNGLPTVSSLNQALLFSDDTSIFCSHKDPNQLISIVSNSLIRSVIEYASAVFANLPKYLSDALEGIQKRALRIILSIYIMTRH